MNKIDLFIFWVINCVFTSVVHVSQTQRNEGTREEKGETWKHWAVTDNRKTNEVSISIIYLLLAELIIYFRLARFFI